MIAETLRLAGLSEHGTIICCTFVPLASALLYVRRDSV
jgi:hypothetical protein